MWRKFGLAPAVLRNGGFSVTELASRGVTRAWKAASVWSAFVPS